MYFSDSILLRAVVHTISASGYDTEANTDTAVWADKKSTTRAEFYAADKAGIRADVVFDIHAEDWGNQQRVVYGAKVYDIVRSYAKGLGVIELVCAEVVL
jgi:SPP1 family predicted phage head-tail adaptor